MFSNVLSVHVSLCAGRSLCLHTFMRLVSPSGRASTGEACTASEATSLTVSTDKKQKFRQEHKQEENRSLSPKMEAFTKVQKNVALCRRLSRVHVVMKR